MILGHGSGGQLSNALLRDVIGPALAAASPGGPLNDAAVVDVAGTRVAFTTDSFVVSPIRFPGGDIGELAVNGTVNDLAMMGAQPLAISLAYVIEEGLAARGARRDHRLGGPRGGPGGRADRHRRHEGRGPRRRRPAVREHGRASAWCPTASRRRPTGPGPATRSSCRARSASTAWPS